MTWGTPRARQWVDVNVAALLRIALEEDHEWLRKGPDGEPLDEFAQRRVKAAVQRIIRKAKLP